MPAIPQSQAVLARERRQLSRLETLIDVIFALMFFRIATELPLPDAAADWRWTGPAVWQFIAGNSTDIFMTFIGVALLVVYWGQNNVLFGSLARTNLTHAALAIAQITALVFYGYTLRLTNVLGTVSATQALQSAALAAVGLFGVAGWWYAAADRHLLSRKIDDSEVRDLRYSILAEPLTALLTVPAAFLGPSAWELAWLAYLPLAAWLKRRATAQTA